MADELQTKRIIELAQKTEPEAGDNLAVDNATSGTRRILWENLLDGNLAEDKKAAPAGATGRAIEDTKDTFTHLAAQIKSGLEQIADNNYLELSPNYEIGGITNGENTTFNSAFRMVENLTIDRETVITCETGYRYLIAYYQSDGTFISQTSLTTADTVLPAGTTFRILIRKQPDQYLPAGTDPSIFTDHVHINEYTKSAEDIIDVKDSVDDLKEKSLFNFKEIETTITDGVMSNSGSIQTSSAYQKHLTANVSAGDLVKVSGINYASTSYPLYLLLNGDNIVSYYHETVTSNSYLTRKLIIPEGVNKIIVNQSIDFGAGSIAKAEDNSEVIDEMLTKIETVNPYFTDNNNVLWIGTSIPESATYPQKACEANGYNCINRSLGSSKLCFENTYISGSDVNKGKRLTATVAELEALYREDVTNGVITEATLNMWKNYSYENSILPYINGTNPTQVSMIVLDHGYNDRGTIYTQMQDVDNIDWTSTDRSLFTGAFKYLLNKIQEINPFIKIVISGYFTNTVERLAFSYNSPQICGMQELIGKHYDIYVMKAWEHTQINPIHVAGTSNYIDDFNATYGTSYTKITPDANGNITALQMYCPDGIHPHTDKTGRCNKRLNAVYTKLLAHTI